MGASDLLQDLGRRGISVTLGSDGLHLRPRAALTPELLGQIKANREAIIQALQAREQAPDTSMPVATVLQAPSREEQRRQRVLSKLEDSPSRRYAVLGDDSEPQYPGRVVLAVAMRSEDGEICSCNLLIAADRYDGARVLELAEQHSRPTIH